MLKTTRLFARMLTLRRFALTSAGRSQRARRTSAYQALKAISVVGCFCQNRRGVEIAMTRIACQYAPMVGAGQPALSLAHTMRWSVKYFLQVLSSKGAVVSLGAGVR